MERNNESEKGGGRLNWIEPKTDWTDNDRFDAPNYNRIKNNLAYLHEFAEELYKKFNVGDMGSDKDYSSFYYADEINTLADNLEIINSNTYPLDIGEKTLYMPNQAFIGWQDLNRIESACLRMYELLQIQKANLTKLPFRLGNMKGVKI